MVFAVIDYINKKWTYRLKVDNLVDETNIFLPQFKKKKSKKYAYKVLKVLDKLRINSVVISNELLKNREFCSTLAENSKYIVTGRRIYKALIFSILKDVSNQMKQDLRNLKIVMLVEGYSVENVDLIKIVAKEVKSLTIVTTDKDRFERLIQELFERYGIIIKVFEKSRSNYKNANIIVNVDFPSYDMNKINVSNNSLVICGFAKHFEIKKSFNGIIIKDIDIISNVNKNQRVDDLSFCEAKIYNYQRKLKENARVFERDGYRINGYFGENGKILLDEFRKLGKILLDK